MKTLLITIFTILYTTNTLAAEPRYLGRSPRGLLMGDAYTSLATDEFTLFYNPALLARHKGFSFFPLNPTIEAPNILAEQDRFTNIGSDPSDFSSAAMGFPIHIGLGMAPGFKMGKFGMTAIMNQQTNLSLQNAVSPTLTVDHRYDKGFIAGYASPVSENLAIGASFKYLKRESLDNSFYLFGTSLLDALSAGELDEVVSSLGQVNGQGVGFDLGFDYVKQDGGNLFSVSLALLDIYTKLTTDDNPDDYVVQDQPMQINLGSALVTELGGGFGFKVSADIRNLESQMELVRRLRLGVEVDLSPALSILAGVNALSGYSYGAKVNLGLLKVYAGFYSEEIGEKLGQEKADRILVYLSFFDFNFDPGV